MLGGNDGIVSTASLVIGIASATPDPASVLVGGVAGLVAGALSMAAGEYISVSAERDAQRVDVALEADALERFPREEREELVQLYEARGLSRELAEEVADALMDHDALGTHLHEELNLDPDDMANPWEAAVASALSFASGALPPVLVAAYTPQAYTVVVVMGVTALLLAGLGGLSSWQGGAPLLRGTVRVMAGGLLAMGLSALIGTAVGRLI